jgi:cell division protein FtsB
MLHRARLGAFVALALVVVGCQGGPSKQVQARLSQLDSVTAQRDSLFSDVAENARLLNELNTELSKVKGLSTQDPATAESPMAAAREDLLGKVHQITTRLAESEKRLAQSRRQLRHIRAQSDSLKDRVANLESQVGDFEAMIASQKTTVASLTQRVQELEAMNVAFQDTMTTMRDTIASMETRENTAYYIVGTEKELLDRGVIQKEGGHHVLFIFGKAGQTIVPARQLDVTQFTQINLHDMTDIPLPDSTANYKIASRQDLTGLATPVENRNMVRGSLKIEDPDQFWRPSKFLIVVRS